MRYRLPAGVRVARDGAVFRDDEKLGGVESCYLIYHYKTVPDKRRPGWSVKALDGTEFLSRTRRFAVERLVAYIDGAEFC